MKMNHSAVQTGSMKHYEGVALITGAGSELGQAVVQAFVSAGCTNIVLADTSLLAIEGVRDHFSSGTDSGLPKLDLRLVEYDSEDSNGAENMVKEARESFGSINYCVNCSTTSLAAAPIPTAEMDAAMFKAGLTATSRALWLCCRAQLRTLLSQHGTRSSITNIVPYGNLGTHPGHALLAAAGYGGVGMSKSMARDHVNSNVRVNVVAPAVIASTENAIAESELQRHMKIPGRTIESAEVANAAVFLAGEGASGITGVVLPVDAGWSMTHG
ncbi:unnamed protein product [Cercospora beticola]|nr:unnamed protein product [Cercospora beticola]